MPNNGEISESCFILFASKMGWQISKPLYDNYPYDFIINRGNGFEGVQVKTARKDSCNRKNRCRATICRNNGNSYYRGDFDLLFIVYNEHMWLIPWKDIKAKNNIYLSLSGGIYYPFKVT